jgi:Domain of unknown function DUF11
LAGEHDGCNKGTGLVRFVLEPAVSPLALAVSLTLVLAGSGCGRPTQSPGTPQPTPTPSPPAPAVLNTPTSAPTVAVLATPTLTPTPTPLPPTPTPVPRLPLSIRAELDPPTPRAGEEFVVALSITNEGERPARGIYVATTGPWDRWTVIDVEPSGTFARDATGWHLVSPTEIQPHETRTIEVHVRAEEPTEEQLTFAVREAEPGELP